MTRSNLRVLYLAAEADPFVKVGGLGDVAGSLPAALGKVSSEKGGGSTVDIRLVIPFHGAIQRQKYSLQRETSFEVPSERGPIQAEALYMEMDGVAVYLITGAPIGPDQPVYTADPAVDGYKFTFFSLAALELAKHLDWSPHIVHANDWHTAPAVYWLHLNRAEDPFYYTTETILGIHNLPYLGVGASGALRAFGLPPAEGSELPEWAQHTPLPLGLLSADHIVAASPTYAREILTPEFGSGLHQFLARRTGKISGILNGIDPEKWDPRTDPYIRDQYSVENLEGRTANKIALQEEFGLRVDDNVPLLGMVTRMDHQKGVDLAAPALRKIKGSNWQAILLGTGDPAIEASVRRLETDLPEQVRAAIRFDAALSRKIFAGADMLLIPSRYEPCGLTQMIAMRYGCVPVARAVGGLKDTIQDYQKSEESTGFLFHQPSSAALSRALNRAFRAYEDRDAWRNLQQGGMRMDFSWNRFAIQYLALYRSLVDKPMKLEEY